MKEKGVTHESEQKMLSSFYPMVMHKGKKVKYDPEKHALEKGEAIKYFVIESGDVKKGVIQKVTLSNPFLIPVYTILGKTYMNNRVWPDVEAFKKHKADRKKALNKLTRKDRKVLGV